ncbi:hypothetical protein F0L68_41000 [Solihabitans fulvus]|uniref:Uncharacterized protein n=1 Tax=Solihabitans fulvus TaxID=1892852 RepID=A0A5B2W5S8_9PSEU|nr:hypothetical protein [Solihabitans fulvus]KAA2245942.1 hypothetical protein F0L68_41000 [Solihabitans fulvus]
MAWPRRRITVLRHRSRHLRAATDPTAPAPAVSESDTRQLLADVHLALINREFADEVARRVAASTLALWDDHGVPGQTEGYLPYEQEIEQAPQRLAALVEAGVLTDAQADQFRAALAAPDALAEQDGYLAGVQHGLDAAYNPELAAELDDESGPQV